MELGRHGAVGKRCAKVNLFRVSFLFSKAGKRFSRWPRSKDLFLVYVNHTYYL